MSRPEIDTHLFAQFVVEWEGKQPRCHGARVGDGMGRGGCGRLATYTERRMQNGAERLSCDEHAAPEDMRGRIEPPKPLALRQWVLAAEAWLARYESWLEESAAIEALR